MKTIWYHNEIKIANELQLLATNLTQEFLNVNPDYFTLYSKGVNYSIPNEEVYVADANIWKTESLRYVNTDKKIETNFFEQEQIIKNYPTAVTLTKKYIQHCGCSGYSSIEPNSKINAHTDIENTDQKFVRIHIPLFIPQGETYFDVCGTRVYWSNIFAFDNSKTHSAHNNTNQRRLIYIIDISREFLNIT
jgi:hypothetical protein